MPEFDCARCGTAIDTQERHATVETEVVDPDGEAVEPSSHFLCLDCHDGLKSFLDGTDG